MLFYCKAKHFNILLILLLVPVLFSCKKKLEKNGSSKLKSLASSQSQFNSQLLDSLKPGEFILTFDDGPVIPSDASCSSFQPSSQALPSDHDPSETIAMQRSSLVGETATFNADDPDQIEPEPEDPITPSENNKQQNNENSDQPVSSEITLLPQEVPYSLTADDYHSGTLIDFLISNNIPATLFIVSLKYRHSETAKCFIDKAIASDSVIIANHTWSHLSSALNPTDCNQATPFSELYPELTNSHELTSQDNPSNTPSSENPTTNSSNHHPLNTSEHPMLSSQQSSTADDSSSQEISEDPITNPNGFSMFLLEEVKQAHCLINERLEHVFEDYEKAKKYPLFYRAPGGFWDSDLQDRQSLIESDELKNYLGPIYWQFGGQLSKISAADYKCWEVALDFKYNHQNKIEIHKETLDEEFIADLENPLVTAPQACANMYIKSILLKDKKDQKGIILLHDNHQQTVEMFIKYLYPAMIIQGFKFVGLEKIDYIKDLIDKLEHSEQKPDFLDTPCKIPVNHCTCCSEKDQSCCGDGYPPPMH